MRIDNPFIVFVVALAAQLGAAVLGDRVRRTWWPVNKLEREDLNTALTATLTLLALIIGFSFSMAVSRYGISLSQVANLRSIFPAIR
jgi:hypothetical protein